MTVEDQIDSDDMEFITKREAYCTNRCKFKLEPLESEVKEDIRKHIKMLVYCEGCGFIDDLEVGVKDEPKTPGT